ncbi:flippase [Methanococcoides sp. LMO-2]|uniref:Flippase n=1 Tax=Methanococcoides cohabitans TaxID=3136559 RepID=A0ABU9KV66_9EURY
MSVEPIRRQSLISFVWKISLTFIGFLSTMYFAHTVGAGILGVYFLFTAYFGVINLFSDGGLGGAAIKRISEGKEQNAYFSAFFVLRSLFLITVILCLLTLKGHFTDLNDEDIFNWLLIALAVSLFYGPLNNALAGLAKVGIRETCCFINEIARIFTQVIAVFFGYGIAGLAGGFVIGMIVATIIELRFFDLRLTPFKWRHVKNLSSFSFWLFLTSSGVMLYSYADTIMIGYYLSNSDIGIYRVAVQFTSIAALATTSMQVTLWPRISRWGKTGEIRLVESSLSEAIKYALLIAMPICIGGVVVGDKLLYYFYGDEFVQGYPVLVILCMTQIISVFQLFFLAYLSALDMQKKAFKVTSIAATLNIVMNAILIPLVGIVGAAIATLTTIGINGILARKMLATTIQIKFEYSTFFNILKASLLMGMIVGVYRLIIPLSNVWLAIIAVFIGGMVYGILLLKFDDRVYGEIERIFNQFIQ